MFWKPVGPNGAQNNYRDNFENYANMEKYRYTGISTLARSCLHPTTVESYSGAIEHTYDKTNQSYIQHLRQSS